MLQKFSNMWNNTNIDLGQSNLKLTILSIDENYVKVFISTYLGDINLFKLISYPSLTWNNSCLLCTNTKISVWDTCKTYLEQ